MDYMNWSLFFDTCVGMGEMSPAQKLPFFLQASENLLAVPEVTTHTDIRVTGESIKVSWKDGRQIVKADHCEGLTEYLLAKIAQQWRNRSLGNGRR